MLSSDPIANPYLLPAEQGEGHRALGSVADLVRDRVFKWTGLRFHLHLYRHILATIILRENPGALPTAAALLGHAPGSSATSRYGEVVVAWAAQEGRRLLNAEADQDPLRMTARRRRNA